MFGLINREVKYTPITEDPQQEYTKSLSRRGRKIFFIIVLLLLSLLPLITIYRGKVYDQQQSSKSCLAPKARKEWRHLNSQSKREYISAVQCLHKIPSRQKSEGQLSDDFPYVHIRVSGGTHYTPSFLLWHRYFISIYESMLQNDCGYDGVLPYWDWTLDWQDPTRSPIWNSQDGFGGDGIEGHSFSEVNNGSCIGDGPFVDYEVRYTNQKTFPHCLSRGFGREKDPARFSGDAFAPEIIEALYSYDDLTKFSMSLEETSHDAIPNGIGGDFSLFTAPSDPVWFIHHAQIDRLFWRWQNADPERRKSINGLAEKSDTVRESLEAAMEMHDLAADLPASAVLDTESGMLCYTYE